MRHTHFFTLCLLLLTLISCKDKNKSVYEGCCGTEPTTDAFFLTTKLYDTHGNLVDSTIEAKVYIPNIITNNGDGDSDVFLIFGGFAIKQVISLDILDQEKDLLLHHDNFLPNDPAFGWEGVRSNGTLYQGSFYYEVKVEFINGLVKTYSGKSCAYNCSDEGFPVGNLPKCAVPAQHDGYGGFDPGLPFPEECF